ncbi:MAG: Mitochondrial zinc maintenance protein 1, mitochondrial [Thelocarpon impressellum]|nr:MAG: Mitochondrial zinc maintenance protein 1, mitochondrial [Thelocarpon impressellum]
MALEAYRHLLRAARVAFQGDARLLTAARHEARKGFESGHALAPGSHEAKAGVAHAEEVARILRHNIVQGQRANEEEQSFKLRIHDEIERGDNETIKLGSMGKGASTQCCSSR